MALSFRQKAGWGLADMGIVIFIVLKQLLILSFLTTVLGVPVGLAGRVTAAVLIFDILTDPIVGWLSDRTQTRWGRRAPWLVAGAVLLTAGSIGIFSAPQGSSPEAAVRWVAGFFVVATIGFTMVSVPYGAMAGEITRNPAERSTMTGWRMVFGSIGILIGGAVIPGLAQGIGYAQAILIVAPMMLLPIWISVWVTRDAPRIERPSSLSPLRMLKTVYSNAAFRVLVILYGVMNLVVSTITAGLPFAALYLILDSGDTALSNAAGSLGTLSLMFSTFVVGAILSQALWVYLSFLLGKLMALVSGLCLYVLLLTCVYLMLPNDNITLMAGMFAMAGIANGAFQQMPWAMYPDLMDVTRDETGEAIEGAFAAIWLFGQKLANAVAPLMLGFFLASAGWRETTKGVTEQTDTALNALHLAITLIPAAILCLAIAGLLLVYRPKADALFARARGL